MDTSAYRIELEIDSDTTSTESIILNGINANAAKVKDQKPILPFAFTIKSAANEIMGGVMALLYYDCLYIDLLWVHEECRGKDFGSLLVKKCEERAIEHQCTFATVETMDWEALPFYKKHGYEVEFIQEGFAKNSKKYLLRKPLVYTSASSILLRNGRI